jgi:hypothetical protein
MQPKTELTITNGGPYTLCSRSIGGPQAHRVPWLHILCAAVILFTYFDVYHHYWFLKLVDGYVIKAWLPPALLLLLTMWSRGKHGSIGFIFQGLKYPIIFMAIYFLFGSISLVWNESIYLVIKYSLVMFGPVMVFFSIIILLTENRFIENSIHLLFWAGVLLSFYVLYMYDIRGYQSWVGEPYVLRWMWTQQEAHYVLALNYHSAGGFFDYSKTLKLIDEPAFAAMLAPLVIFGFFKAVKSSKWQNKLFILPSAFLLYTLIGTTSRSSFIAFFAGLSSFLWFIRRKWVHVIAMLMVTAALVYGNTFMLYRLAMISAAVYSKTTDSSEQASIPFWLSGLEKALKKVDSSLVEAKDPHIESIPTTFKRALQHPLLGYGISKLLDEHAAEEMSWYIEHNRYLFIMSTSGFLTVIPYLLFIISLLWIAWKYLNNSSRKVPDSFNLGILLFSAIFLFVVQINNCGLERYYYWVFFGFAAAWIRNDTILGAHENTSDRTTGRIALR